MRPARCSLYHVCLSHLPCDSYAHLKATQSLVLDYALSVSESLTDTGSTFPIQPTSSLVQQASVHISSQTLGNYSKRSITEVDGGYCGHGFELDLLILFWAVEKWNDVGVDWSNATVTKQFVPRTS